MAKGMGCHPVIILCYVRRCVAAYDGAVNCLCKGPHVRNSGQLQRIEGGLCQQPAASKELKPLGNEFCQKPE